jgi:hypothetical protein
MRSGGKRVTLQKLNGPRAQTGITNASGRKENSSYLVAIGSRPGEQRKPPHEQTFGGKKKKSPLKHRGQNTLQDHKHGVHPRLHLILQRDSKEAAGSEPPVEGQNRQKLQRKKIETKPQKSAGVMPPTRRNTKAKVTGLKLRLVGMDLS